MRKLKIPKGLSKCKKCGEYAGFIKEKDLPPGHKWFKTKNPERLIKIICICEGMHCKICKKKKIHRVCSNFYDEKTKSIWHVPGFIVWSLICDTCRDKIK